MEVSAAFAADEAERAGRFAAELHAKCTAAGLTEADLPPDAVAAYTRAREYAAQWHERFQTQRKQQGDGASEAQARARAVHLCARLYVGGIGYELGRDEVAKVPYIHILSHTPRYAHRESVRVRVCVLVYV
jgi:hypothetical protein